MQMVPPKKVSIVEFLREFFEKELTEAELKKICDESPEILHSLKECYFQYIEEYQDFAIYPRKNGESRPMLWGAIDNGGDFGGGASPEVLKTSILIYDSVLITDSLHVALSGFDLENWKSGQYRPSNIFKSIQFLFEIAPLIDAGVVNIVSDRAAFRNVRRLGGDKSKHNWYDGYSNEEIAKYLYQGRIDPEFDRELPHRYPKILGYLDLVDYYDADITTNNYSNDWIFARCLDYWRASSEEHVRAVKTDHFLNLDLTPQSIKDIVSIRNSSSRFSSFRQTLNNASSATNEQEFQQQVIEVLAKFNENRKNAASGIAKQAALSVLGLSIDFAITGVPVGTGAALGLGVLDHWLQTEADNRRSDASTAVTRICTSLLV